MSKKPTDIGMNRTGTAMSPVDAKKVAEEAKKVMPQRSFSTAGADAYRRDIAQQADPIGTMPPPGSVKGAAKTMLQSLKGKDAQVFLDLVGQRLAFERVGTRLYEALLVKFDAAEGRAASGVTREDIEQIRDEELEHFGLLVEAMERMGADPTAVTPAAEVMAVASTGPLKVLTDPRTTFTQCLDVMLMLELTDNDAWLMLADLADRLGLDDLAERFRYALHQEEQHLAKIRHWLTTRVDAQVGLTPKAPSPAPTQPA